MKNKILFFIQIVFTVVSIIIVTAFASQAGSSEDPLVAKSYVDDKIEQVIKTINSLNIEGTDITTNSYTPVYATTGQTILGDEGTEIILRSGSANAVITGNNGLTNITTGQDIANGQKINLNNLIIVPRNDGRGIKVTENAWFLIKGDYTIE